MTAYILLAVFLAFVAGVAKLLWDKDQELPTIRRPVPPARVLINLDMLHAMMDELEDLRLHAGRLRRGVMALVDHWPAELGTETREVLCALVEESAEVVP